MFKKIAILATLAGALCLACIVQAGISASVSRERPQLIRVTLRDVPFVCEEAGTGTNGFGGVKVFELKEGYILMDGIMCDLRITIDTNDLDVADGGDIALGTATAIATTGAITHTSTRADLIANISVDPITGVVQSVSAAASILNGTAAAKSIYVNMLIDDGDISTQVTNLVNGNIWLWQKRLGDY